MSRLRRYLAQHTLLERVVAHTRTVLERRQFPEGRVPPAPKRVVVEPTNACNLACAYCGNKDMLRPRTYLSFELYARLIDEMVALGIPRITLHTIGEPTLHPRLPEMIALAAEKQRVITISTNGTLLGKDSLARAIVAAGPDVLNFSVDSADDETLGKTRDGLKVEVVVDAMKKVRALRDEIGPIRASPWGPVRMPTITVTCVLTPLFTRAVEKRFFEVFGPLADDFLFHYPNNHADYVADEPFHRRSLLPKAWRDRLYKAVRHTCNYPWDALFLLSDGTMSVCRFDFDARIRIGRFGEQSLQELWHGQQMASLRRAHMSFDFKDWAQCESCTATYYENRHEHYAITRRLMKRNGLAPGRHAWLSQNPLNVPMGANGKH